MKLKLMEKNVNIQQNFYIQLNIYMFVILVKIFLKFKILKITGDETIKLTKVEAP